MLKIAKEGVDSRGRNGLQGERKQVGGK